MSQSLLGLVYDFFLIWMIDSLFYSLYVFDQKLYYLTFRCPVKFIIRQSTCLPPPPPPLFFSFQICSIRGIWSV
uniref:Uncharacterized protein n=1 Tax=Solanum lycopersicum TaxID=4081 RepID=A0A3Q7FYY1_SOLLC